MIKIHLYTNYLQLLFLSLLSTFLVPTAPNAIIVLFSDQIPTYGSKHSSHGEGSSGPGTEGDLCGSGTGPVVQHHHVDRVRRSYLKVSN